MLLHVVKKYSAVWYKLVHLAPAHDHVHVCWCSLQLRVEYGPSVCRAPYNRDPTEQALSDHVIGCDVILSWEHLPLTVSISRRLNHEFCRKKNWVEINYEMLGTKMHPCRSDVKHMVYMIVGELAHPHTNRYADDKLPRNTTYWHRTSNSSMKRSLSK